MSIPLVPLNDIVRPLPEDHPLFADWSRQCRTAEAILQRHFQDIHTVLLADEVGMGKTYAALACLAHTVLQGEENRHKALLIVPPGSVLAKKWEQDIQTFNAQYVRPDVRMLRSLALGSYWDIVKNLHDFTDQNVQRVTPQREACVARLFGDWWALYLRRVKKRGYRQPVFDQVQAFDPAYLEFCSIFSPKAFFGFMDRLEVDGSAQIAQVYASLQQGNTQDLRVLFKAFAAQQDSFEPNIFIMSMGILRNSRSDHSDARLLAAYVAAHLLAGLHANNWALGYARLCRANVCPVYSESWFMQLSGINLWGLREATRAVLAEHLDEHRQQLLKAAPDDLKFLHELGRAIMSRKMASSGIEFAVVDEVHNWKNGKNGAAIFKKFYATSIPRKLMLTATPFQLHENELQRVFDYVCAPNDATRTLIAAMSSPQGELTACLTANDAFLQAWNALDSQDETILRDRLHDSEAVHTALLALRLDMGVSEALRTFATAARVYGERRWALASAMRTVILRHTKCRDKRHVHAGQDYAPAGLPRVQEARKNLYPTLGLGEPHDAMLQYVGMRAAQLVRHDLGESGGARLLQGITSSWQAFREGKNCVQASTRLSTFTSRYLDYFNRAMDGHEHPKVKATADRAAANALAGRKTLIFCERLATQAALQKAIQTRLRAARGTLFISRREMLLRDFLGAELYWSRSWLAAHSQHSHLNITTEEQILSMVLEKATELNIRSPRGIARLLDMHLLQHVCTDVDIKTAVDALLQSPNILKEYLERKHRVKSIDVEAIEEDEPGSDDALENLSRQWLSTELLQGILAGVSVWHVPTDAAEARSLHVHLWRLIGSEMRALVSNCRADEALLRGLVYLLRDVPKGLRKVLLRVDWICQDRFTNNQNPCAEAVLRLREAQATQDANPWLLTERYLQTLADAEGSLLLPLPGAPSTRRQSLWRGVFLRGAGGEGVTAILNGSVASASRVNLCAAFNSPLLPDILVCTAIGSEGIDLHLHCQEVIHHDMPWNPAHFEQRTGRLDRVGGLAEKTYAALPDTERLFIGVPFLAHNYEDFQYNRLRIRAQKLDVLLGSPEFAKGVPETAELEVRVRDSSEEQVLEACEATSPAEPGMSSLPECLLRYLDMDLSTDAEKSSNSFTRAPQPAAEWAQTTVG